jgi:hypothetical protein
MSSNFSKKNIFGADRVVRNIDEVKSTVSNSFEGRIKLGHQSTDS